MGSRFYCITGCCLFCVLIGFNVAAQGNCLTAQCHGDGKFKVSLHPEESGCQDCHEQLVESHPEKEVKNFKLLGSNICSDCHDNIAGNKISHKPVEEGKCLLCHSPHGGLAEKLLVKEYTAKPFVNYRDDSYQLCFSCHARDLLRFPDTSFSTGFRDGERNLHYLHVNKEKRGRNCILCHKVHGSDSPKLIASKVAFGKWQLPLHFEKTETGGSCTPGCHKMESYNRQKGKQDTK